MIPLHISDPPYTADTSSPLLPAVSSSASLPLPPPTYPRDITLYSGAILSNQALFQKMKDGDKIYELRKKKIAVKRPYVVFHPNADLQKAGFSSHIIAHISDVETKFNPPSGLMDFALLCEHTQNGFHIGFDSAHALRQHMRENNMRDGYLYPIKHPREEEIIWTTDPRFTSLYNQVFLSESYLHKQATPSNPHTWLFWFPETPPGQLSSDIPLLFLTLPPPRRSNPIAAASLRVCASPAPSSSRHGPAAGTQGCLHSIC